MSMWSYPEGSIINGVLTEHRTVRGPLPVTINDKSYGIDIFEKESSEFLANLGIFSYIEDSIPEHYSGGVPVDVQEENVIRRTYPNPILQADQWRANLTSAIQTKKVSKRDGGFVVDSKTFDSDAAANMAYLNFSVRLSQDPTYTTLWKASGNEWVTMDASLFTQVAAAFAANMEAAFGWQAEMDAELSVAPDTYEALKFIEELINS